MPNHRSAVFTREFGYERCCQPQNRDMVSLLRVEAVPLCRSIGKIRRNNPEKECYAVDEEMASCYNMHGICHVRSSAKLFEANGGQCLLGRILSGLGFVSSSGLGRL